jgi:hypothetical protein
MKRLITEKRIRVIIGFRFNLSLIEPMDAAIAPINPIYRKYLLVETLLLKVTFAFAKKEKVTAKQKAIKFEML